MELFLPDQIALDETSKGLIEDVEETARRVNEYRPLPPEVVRRIEEELLGERVYSSNAIEGNTLDLRETVMILRTGTVSGPRLREAREARNLGEAVKAVSEAIALGGDCHTSGKLGDIHRLILREINDEWAGRFREHRAMIQAAQYQPPDHLLVPVLMDRVMERLRQPPAAGYLVMAAWAHWALARIHPFHDGNGRIARLWQDLVLFQGGLTCAVIRPQDRRQYLDALGRADEGDFNLLVQLVAQRVSVTFDKYLTELGREKEMESWVAEVVGEAEERVEERSKLAYMRWARKMEQLRWEFEVCASKITEAARRVKVQVQKYDLIDQPRWASIRAGLKEPMTWFFLVDFFTGNWHGRYYFFFGKHYWDQSLDTALDRSEDRVNLLVGEDDGTGKGVRLDLMPGCPFTLREIFISEDRFVRKRLEVATKACVYDRDVSAMRIAQDFLREVVQHRLR